VDASRPRHWRSTGALVALGVLASAGGASGWVAGRSPHAAPAVGRLVPVAARAIVSSAVGAALPQFSPHVAPGAGWVGNGSITARARDGGVTFAGAFGRFQLRLARAGRGSGSAAAPGAVGTAGTRLAVRRSGLVEWYQAGPLGIEQGFTLTRQPSGSGQIALSLRVSGLTPLLRSGMVVLRNSHVTACTYGDVSAWDSRHNPLPVHLRVAGNEIVLSVDDAGARYPLTIDPFVEQAGPLTGAGESGTAQFGNSIALSADGSTLLVGGPFDGHPSAGFGPGAAWVFVKSGGTWTEQGPKLTGSPEYGDVGFGSSVAISANGNTAIIGAPYDGDVATTGPSANSAPRSSSRAPAAPGRSRRS
jgi:trimeric autotransporter adhesin